MDTAKTIVLIHQDFKDERVPAVGIRMLKEAFGILGYHVADVLAEGAGTVRELMRLGTERDVLFFFDYNLTCVGMKAPDGSSFYDALKIPYITVIDQPYDKAAIFRAGGKTAVYLTCEKGHMPVVRHLTQGRGMLKLFKIPVIDQVVDGRPRRTPPSASRAIDILFVGRMNTACLKPPSWIPQSYQLAFKDAADRSLNEYTRCPHETLYEVLEEQGIIPGDRFSDDFYDIVHAFSLHVRSLKRDLVFQELSQLSKKYRVVAVVDDPKRLTSTYGGRIETMGFQMWPRVIQLMDQSKVVINVLPNYKFGSHERIEAAMARGAAIASDYSHELNRRFEKDRGICLYNFNKGNLYGALNELLSTPHRLEHMVEISRSRVLEDNTMKRCAELIIEYAMEIIRMNPMGHSAVSG